MTRKRIVCTEQIPYGNAPSNALIISVGMSDGGDVAEEKCTVAGVISMIDRGVYVYTCGIQSRQVARVIKYWDTSLGRYHIKSAPDCTHDNNLDYLRYCQWKKAA